jgi:hypothetical protein
MLFLPATHTETERRPGIEHRHPEEVAAGGRCHVSDRLMIHMAFYHNRVVAALDINRPGRRIMLVTMAHLLFVMAISVAAGISAVIIRERYTDTDEQDKSDNR